MSFPAIIDNSKKKKQSHSESCIQIIVMADSVCTHFKVSV